MKYLIGTLFFGIISLSIIFGETTQLILGKINPSLSEIIIIYAGGIFGISLTWEFYNKWRVAKKIHK